MKYIFIILCRPVKTIVQTEYRDSIVYRMQFDSIYFSVKDSIYIKEKNDTILIEKWKTIYKDKIKIKTDTVTLIKKETNFQTIEKKQSGWNNFLKYCGYMFLSLMFVVLLYFVVKKK